MIRLHGEITYSDGRSEPVEVLQGEFAAWELHALRNAIPLNPQQAPPVTMLRYLGYAGAHKGKPRAEWPPFDEWDAGVVNVELEGDGLENPGEAETQVFPPVRSAG